jgi:hypothetical protein
LIVGAQHIEAIAQKRGFSTPAEGVRGIVPLDCVEISFPVFDEFIQKIDNE